MVYQCCISIIFSLGSARAVNRRYISDCVPLKIRMQASAGFVSASALGMACGPALAGLLQTKFKLFNLTFNQDTLPGWVMAVAWLLYLVWLWIAFNEPLREEDHEQQSPAGMCNLGLDNLERKPFSVKNMLIVNVLVKRFMSGLCSCKYE